MKYVLDIIVVVNKMRSYQSFPNSRGMINELLLK